MRVLLQHTETGLYLSHGAFWTDNPEAALAFLDEVRAKDHGIYHRIGNTRVITLPESAAGAPVEMASSQ